MTCTPLHSGWTVTAVAGPVPPHVTEQTIQATVPGCVHTDLLAAGLIADPFDGANEADQQWIGNTEWRYRTEFDWSDDGATRHDLVLPGSTPSPRSRSTVESSAALRISTVATVSTFDGTCSAGDNLITVDFAAPVPTVERRSLAHGARPHANHHPFNAMRKMACNFGWDWGMDVATCGIWQTDRHRELVRRSHGCGPAAGRHRR